MDAIVTARVPIEIKDQGNRILKSLGSSPTELINAAYRFVLAEKRLPQAEPLNGAARKQGSRKLNTSQKEALRRSFEAMKLAAPLEYPNGKGFEDLLNDARDDRYAPSA